MLRYTRLPLTLLLPLLLAGTIYGQDPFIHQILDPDLNAYLNIHSIARIGPDLCRLTGSATVPNETAHFSRMDLHADGTVSNSLSVPLDTNAASSKRMILPTQDGGFLFSYLWVADGTDKQVFLKTGADGEVQWNRYYPDNFGLLLVDVEQGMVEKDGHYFVFGHSQDVAPNDGWACALLELDGTGALVTQRLFAGGDDWSDIPEGLIHTQANGLMTVSRLRPYFSQASFPQISVQRWSADLDLEWSKNYSFGNYHDLSSVTELADGSLVITGQVRLSFDSGIFLPFIFKVGTEGEVVWSRRTVGTTPMLTDVVEEADGSFAAVGWAGNPMAARLDSEGALVDAHLWGYSISGFRPTEVVRDASTGEHLVRCAGAAIMRLDADLAFACDDEPLTWTDELMDPLAVDFPVEFTIADPLASFDSTIVSQAANFSARDLCLSTSIASSAPPTEARAWPVPSTGLVHIALRDTRMGRPTCTVLDALGRTVLSTVVRTERGNFQLDIGPLPPGSYALVMREGSRAERVVLMKE